MNKDPDVVPEQSPLIILDIKSDVCMANTFKDTKHTRKFSRRKTFVRNVSELNLHNTVWCDGGQQLAYVGTNNVM